MKGNLHFQFSLCDSLKKSIYEKFLYLRAQIYMSHGDLYLVYYISIKKGAALAPTCTGFGEGSDHFGSYVHSLSLHLCKMLFPGLEPMTSWIIYPSEHVIFPQLYSHHLSLAYAVRYLIQGIVVL
jgi:hypothetical protein